jgi:hypothetical protein
MIKDLQQVVYGSRDSTVFLVVIRGIVGWVRDSPDGGRAGATCAECP